MAINKIVIGNEVKIDLTADTVTAASMLKGVTAHTQFQRVYFVQYIVAKPLDIYSI